MKPELLPYKYKSLKFPGQYSEKAIVQLGWKARKYIKWTDVHIDNDRDLLKKFGDIAVDDKIIDLKIFPRINQILLNVQYWRLDKEKWSIEPPHEPSWDVARDLILACNENSSVLLSYLSEYYSGLDEIDNSDLYRIFINVLLGELVVSVKFGESFKFSIDEAVGEFTELIKCIESKELDLSELEGFDLSSNILDYFGLPVLIVDPSLDKNSYNNISEPSIVVVEEKLPESAFIRITEVKGVTTVSVNVNNNFIKYVVDNSDLKECFIRFINVYASTMNDNPAMFETLNDFNSYLSMNLNRAFIKTH